MATATKATYCCDSCGRKYGDMRKTIITIHTGTCDVCKQTNTPVTHVRNWNWLRKVGSNK
jgi:hypothetical protein